MSIADMTAGMAAASSTILGYAQPVEQKPLGEDLSSDSEGDGD